MEVHNPISCLLLLSRNSVTIYLDQSGGSEMHVYLALMPKNEVLIHSDQGSQYTEMFNNSTRRHGYNDNLSPVEFERRHFFMTESV